MMARVTMVRHGRATGGWDVDPDPGLDDLGHAQAKETATELLRLLPEVAVVSSPLRRCQETAQAFVAVAASAGIVLPITIEDAVAEMPSPEGYAIDDRVRWLQQAVRGSWQDLGERYTTYRQGLADFVRTRTQDTIIFSHYIAINGVIGAAMGSDAVVIASLDNGSCTTFDVVDGQLVLVETGRAADTLFR
jgi:broad specificity phosphatase PhoE